MNGYYWPEGDSYFNDEIEAFEYFRDTEGADPPEVLYETKSFEITDNHAFHLTNMVIGEAESVIPEINSEEEMFSQLVSQENVYCLALMIKCWFNSMALTYVPDLSKPYHFKKEFKLYMERLQSDG